MVPINSLTRADTTAQKLPIAIALEVPLASVPFIDPHDQSLATIPAVRWFLQISPRINTQRGAPNNRRRWSICANPFILTSRKNRVKLFVAHKLGQKLA